MEVIDLDDIEETIIFCPRSSMEYCNVGVGYGNGSLAPKKQEIVTFPRNLEGQQGRPDPDGRFATDVLVLKQSTSTGSMTDVDEFEEDCKWAQFNAFEARRKSIISMRRRAVAFCLVVTILVTATILYVRRQSPEPPMYDSPSFSWIRHSERYQNVEIFLVDNYISSHTDFENHTSAQFLAAQWLAHEDKMSLTIPEESFEKHGRTFIERYAMTVIYFSLGGPKWLQQANFLSETHVTTWQEREQPPKHTILSSGEEDSAIIGVRGCRSDYDDTLYPCTLSLPSNNLVGTVPDEIKFLSRLETLDFALNPDLTGSLPDGIGALGKLGHFSMQWCGLQGTFPSWLSGLEELEYLMIGNNLLTGSIPEDIRRLTNLKTLGLDNNMFSARLDLFGSLTNLTSLYLEGNLIAGSLTSELLSGWDAMEELDLGENLLGGMLPEHLFLHSNDAMKILDLHGNQFQGSLPNAMNQDRFQKLEYLALSDNKFTGIIPQHIGRLQGLKHLDLSMNFFTWILPDSLGQLTALEHLFTGGNRFDRSTIPDFLMYLTNLRDLSMTGNNLSGTIPLVLAQLSNLELLDLHDNSLIGSIPPFIGYLSQLNALLLKSNVLDGTLPSEMDQLTNLSILLLEQNSFFGDATVICDRPHRDLETFVSDCNGGEDYFSFQCSCCDLCCAPNEGPDDCNAWDWDGSWDPAWEHGFRKDGDVSKYGDSRRGSLHRSNGVILP